MIFVGLGTFVVVAIVIAWLLSPADTVDRNEPLDDDVREMMGRYERERK